MKLLLECGSKADTKNNEGKTPLDIARSNGKLGVVEILNKPANAPSSSSSAAPPSYNNRVLMDTLIQISCNQIQPSVLLLKQKIKPENVVDVAALLVGHNIVLITFRGGLLEQPYSTLDNDPDWFLERLYRPICNKIKSKEEKDTVMKVVNHAESLGIIRNADGIRESIIINDKMERKVQTVGTVTAGIYHQINKVKMGPGDVTEHSKSISLALKQFHQAYQKKSKMDRVSCLPFLIASSSPFPPSATEETVGMGFELLLMGIEEVSNQAMYKFTDVDLVDFRIAQWIVSENYQKRLPEHVRAPFENEARQTFGGMSELEDCLYEMMTDSNVVPLNMERRNKSKAMVSLQTHSTSESMPKHDSLGTTSDASALATNEAKGLPALSTSASSSGATEWIAQYNQYLTIFGEPDLSLGDAAALASELSGKDEAKCESALRQIDKTNTGRFNKMRFVFVLEKLSIN